MARKTALITGVAGQGGAYLAELLLKKDYVVHAGNGFLVKHLTVNPGARLSLQKHNHRAEHWVVVQDTARVTRGKRSSTWRRTNPPTFRSVSNLAWRTLASSPYA